MRNAKMVYNKERIINYLSRTYDTARHTIDLQQVWWRSVKFGCYAHQGITWGNLKKENKSNQVNWWILENAEALWWLSKHGLDVGRGRIYGPFIEDRSKLQIWS